MGGSRLFRKKFKLSCINKLFRISIVSVSVFLLDMFIKRLLITFDISANFFFAEIHCYINTRIAETSIISLLFSLLCILVLCYRYIESIQALTLVLAGCISNFGDYLKYGGVIDYIRIGVAIFNLADVAIVFGLSLSVVQVLMIITRTRQ